MTGGGGGGPGRAQRWLLFSVPELLLGIAAVGFISLGVYDLAANPPTLATGADRPFGPDAPLQALNVVSAVLAFTGATVIAAMLGWRFLRRFDKSTAARPVQRRDSPVAPGPMSHPRTK